MLKLENHNGLIDEEQLAQLIPMQKRTHTINTLQMMYDSTCQMEAMYNDISKVDDALIGIIQRFREVVRRIQCIYHQAFSLYVLLKEHYLKNISIKTHREDIPTIALLDEDVERLNEPREVEALRNERDGEDFNSKNKPTTTQFFVHKNNMITEPRDHKAIDMSRKDTKQKLTTKDAMEVLKVSIEDNLNRDIFCSIFESVGLPSSRICSSRC